MSGTRKGSAFPRVNRYSVEAALWYSDRAAQRQLMSDVETRKSLDKLKKMIWRRRDAAAAFEKLIGYGCQPDILLWYLSMLSGRHASPTMRKWLDERGPQSLRLLLGLSSRDFTALRKRLLETADDIEQINSHFHFGVLLTTPHLKWFQPLPALLRGYVSLLELASEKMARGTHVYDNFAKAALIAHVRDQTRRYCDGLVSRLIAAIIEDGENYGAEEHRIWRNQHSDLLALFQPRKFAAVDSER